MGKTPKPSAVVKYRSFGELLAKWRVAAGFARQAQLAEAVSVRQQSVSRWEAGTSRPREGELPLLGSVLHVPIDQLRAAAGYEVKSAEPAFEKKTVIASFDQPFPTDALSPESFERFCAYLLARMHPSASVHQAGHRGHAQDGTDILVTFPDGKVYSYQCKRTEEFGPQKVHTAVATHKIAASKMFLLLSRVASPQARAAVAMHPGWDLWDKDDLSGKVRALDRIDQLSLVDIFFQGRRFELLGVSQEGVWETTESFFAPFENSRSLFNHMWKLVGREQALSDLTRYLADEDTRVIFLVGTGGGGKTRLLKQAVEQHEASHKNVRVRFLSRTAELTKRSLEELGDNPTILVVDDAHDRTDLPLLLQFAASVRNVRLLFALRPYGVQNLKVQAGNYSLTDKVKEITLDPLSKDQAEQLAKQVLRKERGPLVAAKDIANLTFDCPLATVVGAQIVAREKKHFDLAKNEEDFRSTLFARFESVIAGQLGQKADAEPIKKLLRVLALFQPFYLDDKNLLGVIEKVEKMPPYETSRLLKLLAEGGVLFKRGARYRLSPDVLADYVIEVSSIGPNGASTGYAEAAFDAADGRLIENLLLNLGKLDWQRTNGDASTSNLLNGVWAKLRPVSDYDDGHIGAVKAVAFYQPLKALEFSEQLMRRGKFTEQLAEIFKYVAYSLTYLPRACEGLWELGKDDKRELHSHPNHAIRILAELCSVQISKPRAYNEAIVEFGLALASDSANWQSHYTPLDFLKSIFLTENHTTTSKNHALTFNPFSVNPDFVGAMRDRVLKLLFELLRNKNIRTATKAAETIREALAGPSGLFGMQVSQKDTDRWEVVFIKTLRALEKEIKAHTYDPLVSVTLAKSVSWRANYGPELTQKAAKRVLTALSRSLDYRVLQAFVDGYGHEFRRLDSKNSDALWRKHLKELSNDILASYPDHEARRTYLERQLEHLRAAGAEDRGSPYTLYSYLQAESPGLARATIAKALIEPGALTNSFVADAMHLLLRIGEADAKSMLSALLRSGRDQLVMQAGRALGASNFQNIGYGDFERAAAKQLLTSDVGGIVSAGISVLRSVARYDMQEAMALLPLVNVGSSAQLADELLCPFGFDDEISFNSMTLEDITIIFSKLMEVAELNGHWTQEFLASASEKFPDLTLQFFIDRVERAVAENSWKYRPANHGPYIHVPLKFAKTTVYVSLLAKTVKWMSEAKYEKDSKVLFNYRSRELFESAFGAFDIEVIRFIEAWSDTADEGEFKIIANLLEEAPHTFVFTESRFVISLLAKAHRIGPETVRRLSSSLFSSAVGGVRSGVAGEPFPRDLEMKENAAKVLETLSRYSPAYELYEQLLKQAEQEIKRALREREDFED